MDFSSQTLIEFGLNLAGYLIVAALVYVLLQKRRTRKELSAEEKIKAQEHVIAPEPVRISLPTPRPILPRTPISPDSKTLHDPEFVSFRETAQASDRPEIKTNTFELPFPPETVIVGNRRENRRAIYREARRLLAKGKPQRELLEQLPITEDELEILSVTGNA
ncbi:MAG: hypothetical protein KAR42_08600 [candidate division Zixibacteria bacterium]|nr:hypothetical protein [candidate division Zixibacteria bacterium]